RCTRVLQTRRGSGPGKQRSPQTTSWSKPRASPSASIRSRASAWPWMSEIQRNRRVRGARWGRTRQSRDGDASIQTPTELERALSAFRSARGLAGRAGGLWEGAPAPAMQESQQLAADLTPLPKNRVPVGLPHPAKPPPARHRAEDFVVAEGDPAERRAEQRRDE